MATYTRERLMAIISAFHGVEAHLDELETALAEVNIDEYVQLGRGFIQNICCCHNWIHDTINIFKRDIIEAESALNIEVIECQSCGWIGSEGDLEAPCSAIEPSCPECMGGNFLDVEGGILWKKKECLKS